jgi:hypothetical protein
MVNCVPLQQYAVSLLSKEVFSGLPLAAQREFAQHLPTVVSRA